jgi:hypothetical protein
MVNGYGCIHYKNVMALEGRDGPHPIAIKSGMHQGQFNSVNGSIIAPVRMIASSTAFDGVR